MLTRRSQSSNPKKIRSKNGRPRLPNWDSTSSLPLIPLSRLKSMLWSQSKTYVSYDPRNITIISSAGVDNVLNFDFAMNNSPMLDAIARFYEFYKIVRVVVESRPLISEVQAAHSSAIDSQFTVPDLAYSVNNYTLTYANFPTVAERGNARVVSCLKPCVTDLIPTPLTPVQDGLLFDAFSPAGPTWISTERPGVPHHGLTVAIESNATAGASPDFGHKFKVNYIVEFKQPKLV